MEQLLVVTVGTGWDSSKGGLSTFNRFLSLTLARSVRVVCSLETFERRDEDDAREGKVELLRWSETAEALNGATITAVIGHGRITGGKARDLSDQLGCPRVHFVHMWAESIEAIKRADIEEAMATAYDRDEMERVLATTAASVVAVGPRLQKSVQNYLADGRKVLTFLPGFATEHTRWTPVTEPPAKLVCLVMGRAEPEDIALKGFDIAARAIANVDRDVLSALPELVVRGLPEHKGQHVKDQLDPHGKGSEVAFTYRPFTTDEAELERDFRQASVVLMPSREEGFGLVGLDAIALGVPCLVSSKSGLGDFLHEARVARNVVVKTTGDLEIDAATWRKEIEFVLRDPSAAFRRAAVLRTTLKESLSWGRSTEALLDALRELPRVARSAPAPRVANADVVEAALHLQREMDLETANETRRMLQNLMATGIPDGDVPAMWRAALECASRARLVDTDALTQLDLAIAVLRQKYASLAFDPRKEAKGIPSGLMQFVPSREGRGDVTALLERGVLVHRDLSCIPQQALDFAQAHGFSPHTAVRSGHAAMMVLMEQKRLLRRETADPYALENLGRLFDAAARLLALDTERLGRGYDEDGHVDRGALDRADTLLVFASDLGPSSSVEVYAGVREAFTPAASFRARAQPFRCVDILRAAPRIEVVASSWKYLYQWGPDASTPEREWETPDREDVKRWLVTTSNGSSGMWLESARGNGRAYQDADQIRRWRLPGIAAAFWRSIEGGVVRAALHEGALHIHGLGEEPTGGAFALREVLRDHLTSMGCVFEDVWLTGEIWPGQRRGQPCLVVPCGLTPVGSALAFVDPQTRALARAPLILPFPVEECAIFDVGSTCLLASTIMHGAPGALAIWDVTGDAAGSEGAPRVFGSPSTKGWALAVAVRDEDAEVYFTALDLESNFNHSSFWRWTASTGQAMQIFHVPSFVTTLAVTTRTGSADTSVAAPTAPVSDVRAPPEHASVGVDATTCSPPTRIGPDHRGRVAELCEALGKVGRAITERLFRANERG